MANWQTLVGKSQRLAKAVVARMVGNGDGKDESDEFLYRISTADEWSELQTTGSTFGGQLDKTTAFIHLSKLSQVKSTLQRFFLNSKDELYLLQIDRQKLGDGLVYEEVGGLETFPHFYGPSRSFSPLTADVVVKAEKLVLSEGHFICSLLN